MNKKTTHNKKTECRQSINKMTRVDRPVIRTLPRGWMFLVLAFVLLIPHHSAFAQATAPSLQQNDSYLVDGKKAWLHIFAGASNFVGGRDTPPDRPEDGYVPADSVHYSHVNPVPEHVEIYQVALQNNQQISKSQRFKRLSPAMAFTRWMQDLCPSRKHIVLLAAKGNTGLWNWLDKYIYHIDANGVRSEAWGDNYLYERVAAHVHRLFGTRMHEIEFKTFLWMTGTPDATPEGMLKSGTHHRANLRRMFNRLDRITGQHPDHILMALIGDKRDSRHTNNIRTTIRPAQIAVSALYKDDLGVQSVDTNNLQLLAGKPHFEKGSRDRLGQCLFTVFANKEIQNGDSHVWDCHKYRWPVPSWAMRPHESC